MELHEAKNDSMMSWISFKLQEVFMIVQMRVTSFQELLEVQADVMGDLIDEYQGWKVHQNLKFGTLLQDHGYR